MNTSLFGAGILPWRDWKNSAATIEMRTSLNSKHEQSRIVSVGISGGAKNLHGLVTAEVIDFVGGPGRTRTCNQTVMSGPACTNVSENIDVFRDAA